MGPEKISYLQKYNAKYKRILHDLIMANVKDKPTPVILDVGCKVGVDLDEIHSTGFKTKLFGMDLNVESLGIARKKFTSAENICLLQADARYLPFQSEVFSLVYSSEVIEHIDKVDQFIQDVYRILEKNGAFIVTTPSKYNYVSLIGKLIPRFLKRPLRRMIYYLKPGEDVNPHFKEYTHKELKRIFEDNGFIVEQIQPGVLRVPCWPLFEKIPLLTFLWKMLDEFLNIIPGARHLKGNFVLLARK